MRAGYWFGVLALALAVAPVVAAQSPQEELLDRAQAKASDAQEDPVSFIEDHASLEGAQREIDWSVSFACRSVEEAGVPPPDLEQCRGREEAVGVEDAEPTEDPVGIADEGARGLVDEAEAFVEELVRDPSNVVAALRRFLQQIVDLTDELLDGLAGTVADAFEQAYVPVEVSLSTISGAASSAWDSAEDFTHGVSSAAREVGRAIDSALDDIAATLDSWFGGEPTGASRPSEPPPEERILASPDAAGMLPCLDCVLEEAA